MIASKLLENWVVEADAIFRTDQARSATPDINRVLALSGACGNVFAFRPALQDDVKRGHKKHCQTRRSEHAAGDGEAQRFARAGAGATGEDER